MDPSVLPQPWIRPPSCRAPYIKDALGLPFALLLSVLAGEAGAFLEEEELQAKSWHHSALGWLAFELVT